MGVVIHESRHDAPTGEVDPPGLGTGVPQDLPIRPHRHDAAGGDRHRRRLPAPASAPRCRTGPHATANEYEVGDLHRRH